MKTFILVCSHSTLTDGLLASVTTARSMSVRQRNIVIQHLYGRPYLYSIINVQFVRVSDTLNSLYNNISMFCVCTFLRQHAAMSKRPDRFYQLSSANSWPASVTYIRIQSMRPTSSARHYSKCLCEYAYHRSGIALNVALTWSLCRRRAMRQLK
jgi:hypothetical protein